MRAIPTFFSAAILALIALLALSGSPVQAQAAVYKEGQHYQRVTNPVKPRDTSKIEVMEVFWYGCPHCNQFQPILERWSKKLPADVVLKHTPAMWNTNMTTHAKIFYTALALDKQKEMHSAIFDEMHVKRKKMVSKKQIFAVFKDHGVEQAVFEKTFDSFGIDSQVKQANARVRGYGVTGTPEIVVNGKYRVSARMAGSNANVLKVVDYLINKERAIQKPS